MWASRDSNSESVWLWRKEPILEGGGDRKFYAACNGNEPIISLANSAMPDLKPGECVEIEDIKLVRKAKPKRKARA